VVARWEAEVERREAEVPLSRGVGGVTRGQEAVAARQQGQRDNWKNERCCNNQPEAVCQKPARITIASQ
jgi:hypothetical protein